MKRSYFFPIALIATGSILLLNQFNMLDFSRPFFLVALFFALGAILLRKAMLSPDRKGLLGGSFFLLLSLEVQLMDWGYIPTYDELIFPMILIPLGIANLVFYLATRHSFSNVTFGLVFIALGMPFIIFNITNITYWEISEMVSTYWPVLLITAGLGFLVDGMLKKAK